ncbi:MAG TPA: heme-binding protein, partial [Kofleriaceae bacterium]
WFTAEPAYVVERRIGELEIRRYAPRVEAHTRLTVPDFETAVDEGFMRLAKYIFGENDRRQKLSMTTPVVTTPRATTHSVAFVMPPDRTLTSLPRPADDRIKLVQQPERRVAVIRFHGRYTDKVMLEQTRRLHELIGAADLETKGQPMFAGFDPPSTLPLLRRTEMWIELA